MLGLPPRPLDRATSRPARRDAPTGVRPSECQPASASVRRKFARVGHLMGSAQRAVEKSDHGAVHIRRDRCAALRRVGVREVPELGCRSAATLVLLVGARLGASTGGRAVMDVGRCARSAPGSTPATPSRRACGRGRTRWRVSRTSPDPARWPACRPAIRLARPRARPHATDGRARRPGWRPHHRATPR